MKSRTKLFGLNISGRKLGEHMLLPAAKSFMDVLEASPAGAVCIPKIGPRMWASVWTPSRSGPPGAVRKASTANGYGGRMTGLWAQAPRKEPQPTATEIAAAKSKRAHTILTFTISADGKMVKDHCFTLVGVLHPELLHQKVDLAYMATHRGWIVWLSVVTTRHSDHTELESTHAAWVGELLTELQTETESARDCIVRFNDLASSGIGGLTCRVEQLSSGFLDGAVRELAAKMVELEDVPSVESVNQELARQAEAQRIIQEKSLAISRAKIAAWTAAGGGSLMSHIPGHYITGFDMGLAVGHPAQPVSAKVALETVQIYEPKL